MWHDMGKTILLETGKTIIPDSKEKTEKGFKSFLIVTYFIWAYPKNGETSFYFVLTLKQESTSK
jgi:hypothetical protein